VSDELTRTLGWVRSTSARWVGPDTQGAHRWLSRGSKREAKRTSLSFFFPPLDWPMNDCARNACSRCGCTMLAKPEEGGRASPPQAARGRARPPYRHIKIQSC
jgi:hypothetical protein